MKKLLVALALLPSFLFAQSVIIQGSVKDKNTKESIPSANVILPDLRLGTSTDLNGFFRMNLSETGPVNFKISFVGRPDLLQTVNMKKGVNNIVFYMEDGTEVLEAVEVVSSNMATANDPLSYTNVSQKDIKYINNGQDLPYLLEMTPSMVVGSDAGTGIGYTDIRLRGTDKTRINVNINGVPVNDAESQGVYWVNIPDIASSTEQVQIQRGVSLSSQGAGSFGGSININTHADNEDAAASISSSVGSFNTLKNTFKLNSGRLKSGWQFNGRLSKITSDGYIDRASSDLNSYYIGASWKNNKTILRLTSFGGHERTYQAWFGVPYNYLETNRTFNPYTYENEVDDYGQQYFQANISRKLNTGVLDLTIYRTYGAGFFEQFQGAGENQYTFNSDTNLADYGITAINNGDTIASSDIIRRRWLDNVLDGAILSYKLQKDNWKTEAGIGFNEYRGLHFGEVVWAEYAGNSRPGHRYYENSAVKRETNLFWRNELKRGKLLAFADGQLRNVSYQFEGADANGDLGEQQVDLPMFNPKIGLVYNQSQKQKYYASFGVSNREPNRNDYRANPTNRPIHETLYDLEAGYKKTGYSYAWSANLYYMKYKNQLVLNGQLNDVGEALHENVDNSHRLGLELIGSYRLMNNWHFAGNLTLSRNQIAEYTDNIDNWDTWGKNVKVYENTNLNFSPDVVAAGSIRYQGKSYRVDWQHKYVGRRYIDNTSSLLRSLDPYYVQNLVVSYENDKVFGENLMLNFKINNILNSNYISNAWAYRFHSSGYDPRPDDPYTTADETTGDYQQMGFFPQAFRHFSLGLQLDF